MPRLPLFEFSRQWDPNPSSPLRGSCPRSGLRGMEMLRGALLTGAGGYAPSAPSGHLPRERGGLGERIAEPVCALTRSDRERPLRGYGAP